MQTSELPQPSVNKGKMKERKDDRAAVSVSRRDSKVDNPEKVEPPRESQSIWMGSDTPFKSANAWFVEPGRSNRSRQEGTSSQKALTQDILLGIATPQPNLPSIDPSLWTGRETPPHIASTSRQPRSARGITDSTRVAEDKGNSREQDQREPPRQPNTQNVTRNQRPDNGQPPDGGDDDDSTYSQRSRRSERQRRRSRTPRPRRRRSSTPRPRRSRRVPSSDDDDGGGSSSDSSGGSSSWGSHSSYSLRSSSSSSRSRKSRKERKAADVIIPYGTIPPTIKSELKPEDLPTWDGNPKSAISYFWKVQE